jgi:hypothetical protein
VLEDATSGVSQDGRSGLRDEDLTDDSRYLYAIDADAGELRGWTVDGAGMLAPMAPHGRAAQHGRRSRRDLSPSGPPAQDR